MVAAPFLNFSLSLPGRGTKKETSTEDGITLSWDFESDEIADLVIDMLLKNLRSEGFYVQMMNINEGLSQARKGNTVLSIKEEESVVTIETSAEAAPAVKQRGKSGRYIPSGIAYILATFNNTKVTFTDLHGNVISWSTGGKNGFKGSRKSTAYAAQLIAGDAAKKAQLLGMKEVEVRIKGPGAGRESAVRGIAAAGMEISVIKDITPVPHNGCRPPKRRRV